MVVVFFFFLDENSTCRASTYKLSPLLVFDEHTHLASAGISAIGSVAATQRLAAKAAMFPPVILYTDSTIFVALSSDR